MAKTCQGDQESSWQSIRERLRRTAIALTRSCEDADDLTQQTFAHVLGQKPEYIGHLGYVRRTMYHLWLDEQRSVRRQLRRIARLAPDVAKRSPAVGAAFDGEYSDAVHHAIDALPPQQHAVIVLRLIEELDYDEIASTLGCSVGTVRANLHLARRRLRQVIEEPS